jgi:hypothetical protein
MPERKAFIFNFLPELLPAGKWGVQGGNCDGINCLFSKIGAEVNPAYIR